MPEFTADAALLQWRTFSFFMMISNRIGLQFKERIWAYYEKRKKHPQWPGSESNSLATTAYIVIK